jgi:hypothetical protein
MLSIPRVELRMIEEPSTRALAATLHEPMHILAEAYRIPIEHDDIRRLTSHMIDFLLDERNQESVLGPVLPQFKFKRVEDIRIMEQPAEDSAGEKEEE